MAEYYNDDDIRAAAINCPSISQLMKNLGLKCTGSNHRIFKRRVVELGIVLNGPKTPTHHVLRDVREYLVENGPRIGSSNLKRKLYEAGLKEPVCEICGIGSQWNGRYLIHHLDHIDGNYYNNTLHNLRILCPNCHSQTETYCKRNGRVPARSYRNRENVIKYPCLVCQCKMINGCRNVSGVCRICSINKKKLDKDEAREIRVHEYVTKKGFDLRLAVYMVKQFGYPRASKKLGFNSGVVRDWIWASGKDW